MLSNKEAIEYAGELKKYCDESLCSNCVFCMGRGYNDTYKCLFRNNKKVPNEWDVNKLGKFN